MLTHITFCYCNDKANSNYKRIIIRKGKAKFWEKNHFIWVYNPMTGKLKDMLFNYTSEPKFKAFKKVQKVLDFILLFEYYTSALNDFNPNCFKPKGELWLDKEKYPPKLKTFKKPTNFIKKEVILRKRNAHEYYTKKEIIKSSIEELDAACKEVTCL